MIRKIVVIATASVALCLTATTSAFADSILDPAGSAGGADDSDGSGGSGSGGGSGALGGLGGLTGGLGSSGGSGSSADPLFTPPSLPALAGGTASPLPKLPNVPKPKTGLLPALPTVPTPGIPALPDAGTVPDLVSGLTDRSTASDNATVRLSPNGNSGISATLTIRGTGVTGRAKGLNPNKRYISLYYGSMSVPQAGRTLTCADARTAAFPLQWGISPEWKVNSDGSGTLNATGPRKLSDGVYTVSIREVPAIAGADPYVGFNPVTYPVRACGATR